MNIKAFPHSEFGAEYTGLRTRRSTRSVSKPSASKCVVMSFHTTLTVPNLSASQCYIPFVTNVNYWLLHKCSLNTALKNRGSPTIQIFYGHIQRHHKFSITTNAKTVVALTYCKMLRRHYLRQWCSRNAASRVATLAGRVNKKGMVKGAANWMSYMRRIYYLCSTNLKLLSQIKRNSINDWNFFKFIISVADGHCGHFPQMPRNLAMPVFCCYVTYYWISFQTLNVTHQLMHFQYNNILV